jgi:hypothetical protein
MIEKKVVAPDVRAALKIVKELYGEDALIVDTSTRRSPREGSLQLEEEVEVRVMVADGLALPDPAEAPAATGASLENEVTRLEGLLLEIESQMAEVEAMGRHPLIDSLRELGLSWEARQAIAADHAEEVPPFEQGDPAPALARLADSLPCVEAMALTDLRGHHALLGLPGAGKSSLARKLAAVLAAEGARVALIAFAPAHAGERLLLERESERHGYEAVLAGDERALLEAVDFLSGRDLVILDMPAFNDGQPALLDRAEALLNGAPLLRHLLLPADGFAAESESALATAHYLAISRADLSDPLRRALELGTTRSGLLSFLSSGEDELSLASPEGLLAGLARRHRKADAVEAGGGR